MSAYLSDISKGRLVTIEVFKLVVLNPFYSYSEVTFLKSGASLLSVERNPGTKSTLKATPTFVSANYTISAAENNH